MTQSAALHEWLIESVSGMHTRESDSVTQWLEDLRLMTETECMCVLQGKSLSKDSTDVVFTSTKTTKDCIDSIRARAHVVSAEFSKLFKKLEKERWKHVKSGSIKLTCQIRSLLHECTSSNPQPIKEHAEVQEKVMEECAKLAQHVETQLEVNGHKPQRAPLLQLLTQLGQSFSRIVDLSLGYLIKKILTALSENTSVYSQTAAINSLVNMGLEGEHMCYLIAREGGVKTLFDLCQQSSQQSVYGTALRAVATICCVPESITELEKVNGVGCLSDILCDTELPEAVRSEAAGVIAQITSPCMDHYQHLAGFIENMDDLIRALTGLCTEASNHEVFLLGAAALANITFMDSMACEFLAQYGTASVLIEACHLNNGYTLFAKDQVATVLANIAGVDVCTLDIVDHHGTELLVQFLYETLPQDGSDAEKAACERVQQKAAIALSRLSKHQDAAQLVVELHGIERLVQLCREPNHRNHSDSVLVACLAALRKISKMCKMEDFQGHEIQQLIQPKLMDSYLICSNGDESFV